MFKVNFAEYVFWCRSRTSPAERPSINRSQAGHRLLDQLTTMSDTLKPSLPFHSCHFLCSLAPRPLPLHSGLWPVFSLYLDFFLLLFGPLSSFSLRHHHSSFPSLMGLASKTGAGSWEAINRQTLSCRTKWLQTQLMGRKYSRLFNKWSCISTLSNELKRCCKSIVADNNYSI